jgi:hypothetical protein
MPTVDYLPVAAAGGANVESQGAFAGSGHQLTGFVSGLALSAQLNKCWRQSSVMAAALANLIADLTGQDVLDDGNVTALLVKLSMMLLVAPFAGTSGGAANVQTLTPTVAPTAYETGQVFRFIAGFTNSGAATLNVSTLGAKAILRPTISGPVALTGREIVAGNEIEVMYDGMNFQLLTASATSANPTVMKKGTNGGDYSSASGSFVDVDNTNLKLVVTIPVGSQLVIRAFGTVFANAIATSVTTYVAIADGGTQVQQQLIQDSNGDPSQTPFAMGWIIAGDGASHTITLQYKKGGGSGANATIINSSGGVPTMLFKLE